MLLGDINNYFEKQRGNSGGYPRYLRCVVKEKTSSGYELCMECVEENNADLWKRTDPWGFAAFDTARGKLGPSLDSLRFIMPTPTTGDRPKYEAFKRRISYLAANNDISITMAVGDSEERLYTMLELSERPGEVVRSDFSKRGDEDTPGRLEKDFQTFLFGKGLHIGDAGAERTNERLALFGRDFAKISKKSLAVEREFPTGAFAETVRNDTRILPTEFVDFVTINKKGELAIVELKFDAAPLEVIAQLLNYVLFFYSYKRELAPLLDERLQCDSINAKIKGYLVSNVFHERFNAVWLYYSRGTVILPFLVAFQSRAYAALLSFIAGVMPPMPILGRSLL